MTPMFTKRIDQMCDRELWIFNWVYNEKKLSPYTIAYNIQEDTYSVYSFFGAGK